MKNTIRLLTIALFCLTAKAQTNANGPLFITGDMSIAYATRQTPDTKGIKDSYKLNLNVANSVQFHGTITDLPQIMEGYFTKEVTQPRSLRYDLACDVVNPKNPAQTKNVGRMYGNVPITSTGVYNYDRGNLTVDILPMGNAGGFTSKFTGTASGKPLGRPANWLDTAQLAVVNITRSVNGKVSTVALKKYDKMEFRQHVIAAGPVAIYPSVTVNGEMLYDYDKSCWFFNNVTAQYADNGMVKIDRLSGTIRWVESPQRKVNGEGEYQFDIRVNEPMPSPESAFSAKVADEASFFETDSSVAGVAGTMKYKDTLRGDTTMASQVGINLTGNNISKQQLMVIAKMVIFDAVIPMNAD